jgi:hypothetical protein
MPNSSMHELLIHEANRGSWMTYFGFTKTLYVLHKYFLLAWKRDIQKIYDKYITYSKAKSKILSYDLYTPLPIPKEP